MTEAEAKLRWCPFARVASAHGATSWNRNIEPETLSHEDCRLVESSTRCIASACMAWRWSDPNDCRRGHCGLADKS